MKNYLKYAKNLTIWSAPLILLLGPFAISAAVTFASNKLLGVLPLIGVVFQIFGFGIGAYCLHGKSNLFRSSFFIALKKYLSSRPTLQPRFATDSLGAALGEIKLRARGTGRISPNASLESRLSFLEGKLDILFDNHHDLREKFEYSQHEIIEKMNAVDEKISRDLGQINSKMVEGMAGDLHLEWAGLCFFVFGTLVAVPWDQVAAQFR